MCESGRLRSTTAHQRYGAFALSWRHSSSSRAPNIWIVYSCRYSLSFSCSTFFKYFYSTIFQSVRRQCAFFYTTSYFPDYLLQTTQNHLGGSSLIRRHLCARGSFLCSFLWSLCLLQLDLFSSLWSGNALMAIILLK